VLVQWLTPAVGNAVLVASLLITAGWLYHLYS